MAAYDNDELVADIRDRGNLPPSDLRFSTAKLLSAATIELTDVILPLLVESQTERAVTLARVQLVPGQSEYRLPSRAAAGRWQSVSLEMPGGAPTPLKHIRPEDFYLQSSTQRGQPAYFFGKDYRVSVFPLPDSVLTLRLPYYQRPSRLTTAAAAATIASISTDRLTVTLTAAPPAGFTNLQSYDLVRGTPGFEVLVMDTRATISGTTVVLPTAVPVEVVAGDYMAIAGTAPVAQCPVEVRGLLSVRAARRALKAVNEGQQASMLDGDVTELTAVATALLSPRADAAPQEWGSPGLGLLQGVL